MMEPENEQSKSCPNCFSEINEGVDFCAKCGRPSGIFVNYDLFKRIWAQGWAYRQAVAKPNSPIILIGMLLLFGLPFGFIVLTLFSAPGPMAIVSIPVLLVYGVIVFRVIKNYQYKEKNHGC